MPARDNRFAQVGVNSGGDAVFERVYDSVPEGTDYESLTKAELQALLSHMALPTSGNKDELIERLKEAE